MRTFTYDAENRLTGVTGGTAPVSLAYDPFGRLYQLTVNGATTTFKYAGDKLVSEWSGTTALRDYAYDGDRPLIWHEGATGLDIRYFHADRLGSVIATSDGSGVVTPYAYGPYGEPQNWAGSRFRYTGQMALPEAQLYHYRARAYDPMMGRFLQTDPIGYGDGGNIYAYTHGDPVNGTDPSGTICFGAQGVVGGDIGAGGGVAGSAALGVISCPQTSQEYVYGGAGIQFSDSFHAPAIIGFGLGGGPQLVFSTANNFDQFSGPGSTANINIGPISISYTHLTDGNFTLSAGWSLGRGLPFSLDGYAPETHLLFSDTYAATALSTPTVPFGSTCTTDSPGCGTATAVPDQPVIVTAPPRDSGGLDFFRSTDQILSDAMARLDALRRDPGADIRRSLRENRR